MTNLNQIFNEKVVVTNNPTITESWGDSLNALEGSEIDYTPYENADFVVYECDFQLSFEITNNSNSFLMCGRMQEYNGSAWVDINNTGFTYYAEAGQAAIPVAYRMILDSWSGSKQIRLAVRGWFDNALYGIVYRGYRVHNAYYTTSTDSSRKSQVVLNVYSIINGD